MTENRRQALGLLLTTLLFLTITFVTAPAQSTAEKQEHLVRLFDYLFGEEGELPANRDVVREGIREKIRMTPAQFAERIGVEVPDGFEGARQEPIEVARGAALEIRETAVSASSDIEAEIHAAINPTDSNNIVVGVISLFSPGAMQTTTVYTTHDFGKTWRKSPEVFRSTGFTSVFGGGDPMFAFAEDGTLYYSWIDLTITSNFQIINAMSWASSSDGGLTWTRPQNDVIGSGILSNGGGQGDFFDKQWMVVDRSGSERNGRLYVGLVHSLRGGGDLAGGMGVRTKLESSDEFVDLTARVLEQDWAFNQLASTVVDPDGKLHMMFFGSRTGSPGDIALWLTGSVDGGESLLPVKKITDFTFPVFSTGQSGERITGFNSERTQPSSHLAVDLSDGPHRGNLYAVWSANGIEKKGTSRTDIYFTRSTDRGTTWSAPMIVNDDGDDEIGRRAIDQFHPSISVNDRGIVTLSWYDRRDDPLNRMTHYYMAHSFDGGLTFSENFAVSSEPTNFGTVGSRNNGFGIGEYVQTVSSDHYAIPVWSDGRKNNGDIDVYIAFVPISQTSSVPDRVVSIGSGLSIEEVTIDRSGVGSIVLGVQSGSDLRVDLVNMAGERVRVVYDGKIRGTETTVPVDFSDLPSGTYILRASSAAGMSSKTISITR